MPVYTAISDILARVGNRPIDAVAPPTTTDVTNLLNQGEAKITGLLRSINASLPAPGSEGGLQITAWVADYVSGLVRKSWAAVAGDGHNPDGRQEVADFAALLADIKQKPEFYSAMLNTGSSGTVMLASNFTERVPTAASPNQPLPTPYDAIVRLNRNAPDSVL